MANSTTNLDLVAVGQAAKEVTVNALLDAHISWNVLRGENATQLDGDRERLECRAATRPAERTSSHAVSGWS